MLGVRSTSGTPRSSSSFLICADSVGWLTKLALGGAAEVAVLGEGDEIAQVAQVHGGLH